MSNLNNLNLKLFYYTAANSLVLAIAIFLFSFTIGKTTFFLLLNGDAGPFADHFFYWFTHLGDGLWWAAWLVGILFLKRFDLIKLLVLSFVFSTLYTQFFKYILLPNEPRPKTAITDHSLIHFVDGVTVHSINSFPSGHTATAFTFLFLIVLLTRKNWVAPIAFIAAATIGFSRVYVAQHFPYDVAGGIVVAIFAMATTLVVLRFIR